MAACSATYPDGGSAVVERMTADRPAPATDRIEVWICDVPTDTEAPIYGDLPLRLALDPATVVPGEPRSVPTAAWKLP